MYYLPYSPKQNRRIERTNRTIREEFYQDKNITKHFLKLKDWNKEVKNLLTNIIIID